MKKAEYTEEEYQEAELYLEEIKGKETKKQRKIRLEKIILKQRKSEEYRQKYLEDIEYSSSENTYSFKFEGNKFTFRGFPTIIEKAQIRNTFNSIAPNVSSSTAAIFGSRDHFLQSLSKGIAYSQFLMVTPIPPGFCVDADGESNEGRYSDFGLSVIMAELEFKKSKKKLS